MPEIFPTHIIFVLATIASPLSASAADCEDPLGSIRAEPSVAIAPATAPSRNGRREPPTASERPAEYFAYRAVPSLFEGGSYPPVPDGVNPFFHDDVGSRRKAAQRVLDRAAGAREARRAAIVDRVAGGAPFDKALVATHVLPGMQARVARAVADDPELRDLPKIALVTSTPAFNVPEPSFARAMDAFLLSDRGEVARLPAKEIFVIGGYDDACLANTLVYLLVAAGDLGLDEITVHVRAALTYSRVKISYAALLAERLMPEARASDWLETINPYILAIPGTYRRTRAGEGHRIRVRMDHIDVALGHAHPRTRAKMNLVIE